MGGKKRKTTELEKLCKLQRKMRRIEKRLQEDSRQSALPINEDGTSDQENEDPILGPSPTPTQDDDNTCLDATVNNLPTPIQDDTESVSQSLTNRSLLDASKQPDAPVHPLTTTVENSQDINEPATIDLTELLGEVPDKDKTFGPDIHPDLAVRLEHIVTRGLTKELNKELTTKYQVPNNAKLLDAPVLNPETRAAISENILKRDKGIETRQKQLASALTCLSKGITMLLEAEKKDTTLIKIFMDGARILSDCQHNDSLTRRNFILFNLKKEMKDELQKTKIDDTLFGQDLAETLKSAKIITKSGADLKNAPLSRPLPNNTKQAQTPATTRNLNWKIPPLNRRPRGNQVREPAPTTSRKNYPMSNVSSSRSYRPPPPPPRSRR